MRFLRIILQIALPLVILAIGIEGGKYLIENKKVQERRSKPPSLPVIETLTVKPQSYQIKLKTRGTVAPRTQSTLVSEVSGKITKVSPNFREGSFFKSDETLVHIDRRDYEQALTIIKAELAQAELALNESQANSEQAARDWKQLGLKGTPNDLVLRQPQLRSSEAALAAAKARVDKANTDLSRTRIKAPYEGRILSQQVDIGQFVSRGSVLASIYAVDYVEVRLPITEQQAQFLKLPESYQNNEKSAGKNPEVTFFVQQTGKNWKWKGRIVRTESTIDIKSRQQFVIVQVDKPYVKHKDGRPPLKIGQFLTAEIKGTRLSQVLVLPRELLRGNDEILVVKSDNTVETRRLEVIWRDDKNVVFSGGLKAGERISKTLLGFVTNGMKVAIKGEKKDKKPKKTQQEGKEASGEH